MIQAASVQTIIIDDMHLACRDLQEQLEGKLKLLTNSIGIVQTDPEFIEAGIMGLLYEMLGIPLVGGTTVSIATNGEIGDFMFSLLVLTSDDVEFCPSRTYGLREDCNSAVKLSMEKYINDRGVPNMVMIFPTVVDELPGDCYVEAVESVCGDVPIFGSLSVNDSIYDFNRSLSVFNGESFSHDMSYCLFFGDVNPRFFMATAPIQSGLTNFDDVVTKASGHIVHEINDMSAAEYFERVGLASDGVLVDGIYFVPLLLSAESGDETRQFVRAIVYFTEDGSAVCRGKIPVGAKIAFGSMSSDDILASSLETVSKITQEKDISVALIFSCIIRRLSIGPDSMKELAHIKDAFEGNIPFMASYSGGEISPVGCVNEFNNYSFIACLL